MTDRARRGFRRPHALAACGLCLMLLPALALAAPPATADAPPPGATFDREALNGLLADIRALQEALARGLDESADELAGRLPGLWYRLETLENRIHQRLPVLREELRKLGRALRDALPAERHDPPPLIEV